MVKEVSSHICGSHSGQHSECVHLLAIMVLRYYGQMYLNVIKTGWKPQEGVSKAKLVCFIWSDMENAMT